MRKKKIELFDICNTILMLLIIFITAYPLYYVVIASFSDGAALSRFTGVLVAPLKPYTLEAYKLVFSNKQLMSGFLNTFFLMTVGLGSSMVMTILGAYFMSLKGPMFKNIFSIMIVITMYFGGGLVPSYLNVRDLGLFDSRWAMVIPSLIGTTNLIILKSGFESVPESLIESAKLDGASYFKILLQVVLPLAKASLAVIALYYGVSYWNAWFNASIYIQDVDKYPLQLVMRNIINYTTGSFEDAAANDMANIAELMKYAMIVVGTVPILAIYPFVQKYFVKGTMIGAVKG